MLPFLIDMARLYEMFVAEWLRQHLPYHIILKDQAAFSIGSVNKVEFRIDLLLIDRATGPSPVPDRHEVQGRPPAQVLTTWSK